MKRREKRENKLRNRMPWKTVMFFVPFIFFVGHSVSADDIYPPYHNEVLRNYFYDLLLGPVEHWHRGLMRRYVSNAEIDRRIDLLIEDFTGKLIGKLNSLEAARRRVESRRLQLLDSPEAGRKAIMRQWKSELKALSDDADDLQPSSKKET